MEQEGVPLSASEVMTTLGLRKSHSYLTDTQLENLIANTGCEIVYRPMLLETLFDLEGGAFPPQPAAPYGPAWLRLLQLKVPPVVFRISDIRQSSPVTRSAPFSTSRSSNL